MEKDIKICKVDDCTTKTRSRGYCSKHVQVLRKYGDPLYHDKRKLIINLCEVEGCNLIHKSKGFCEKHYRVFKRTGNPIRDPETYPKGISKHPLYDTYSCMKYRCNKKNTNQRHHQNYAKRNINVCERWLGKDGFENFVLDMGEKPENYSLDRIDNNSDYTPQNCRWADHKTQTRNRRKTLMILFNGKLIPLAEFCELNYIPQELGYERFKRGMSAEEIINTPVKEKYYIEYNGERKPLCHWARTIGISQTGLAKRIKRGWSIEQALTTPIIDPKIKSQNIIPNNKSNSNQKILFKITTII